MTSVSFIFIPEKNQVAVSIFCWFEPNVSYKYGPLLIKEINN